MDFTPTEEQRELAGLARRILTGNRPLWKEFDAAGLLDPSLTLLQQCSVLIEVGRAAAPIPYLWHIAARTRSGGVHSIALGTWIPNPDADLIVGPAGPVSAEGMRRQQIVDGTEEGMLAHDAGDDAAMRARATVGLCALQVGVLERALEMTAAYACERVQFGRPIGTFQAVTQRLADAYIDVEAVRLTMWQAAWRLEQGLPCETEIATAKFWACDAGHRVAHAAVHIHGGVGIDVEHPMHRYFLAAKRNEFTLGHATDHLLSIGSRLTGTLLTGTL